MIRPWRSSPQERRVAEVSSRSVASSGRSTDRAGSPSGQRIRTDDARRRGAGVPRLLDLGLIACHGDPLHPVHPGLRLHHLTDTLDEEGHLVAHLADVGGGLGQHREVRPVAHAHQEHEAVLHLDDGLQHRAALEEAGGTGREAGEPGRHGRHLLGALGGQPLLAAISRPSADTSTACAAPGTLSTNRFTTQSSSRVSVSTVVISAWRLSVMLGQSPRARSRC